MLFITNLLHLAVDVSMEKHSDLKKTELFKNIRDSSQPSLRL